VESSQDGIVITCCTTPGHPIVYTNPAFERITGFSLQQAQQCGIERFIAEAGEDMADRAALIARHGERRVLHASASDGRDYWCEVRLAVIRSSSGAATHNVFTLTDVTAAQRAEQHLTLLASHDPLTGLPNRRMLMERLAQAVSISERGGMELAVAFLDLDGLKRLNDEYGHEAGDLLLQTVAERIAGCIRQSDTIARLGGDEFVLLTLHRLDEGIGSNGNGGVAEVLAKVQEQIARPILVGAVEVTVTCSIGVSVFRQDGSMPELLLKRADEAMYVAKKSGRNRIVFDAAS
jgi:diguanylate cyclase (GGDEF)-like protein/PAS domain S-box-containing protein